ncbi:MAG TPA: lipid A deacylase LpxR family protein, partial [Gemmatimonadaceae bacterium]|nr:lipid A deacylase LpxR family protein [Gemmatimonadaceae bacterium]
MIRRACAWFVVVMAVPLGAAIAQGSRAFTVRADNDAFDFWMLPWNRPDEEYTSGVHLTYEGGDAPRWARRFLRGHPTCVDGVGSCRTGRLEIGQDIYTPSVSLDDPHAAPGARPNAGWLYLTQAARIVSPTRFDELAVTVGVTGPPSLGRFTQQLAHHAAPAFNRPTDWSQQIGFEPGLIVRYEGRRRAALTGNAFGVDVTPHVGGSLGNVIVGADAGFDVRLGWNLAAPWLPSNKGFSVGLTGGVSGQAVARTLFLDGNTFQDGPRVGHDRYVGNGRAGFELRYRGLSVAYRIQSDTRAYALGPKWHPWSSLVATVI